MTDKKKVVVVVVNYHSADEVVEYLNTINPEDGIQVVVVDNGDAEKGLSELRLAISVKPFATLLEPRANLGYMGGARYAYEQLGCEDLFGSADWFVLSNADVRFNARSLVDGLTRIQQGGTGDVPLVVAPRIESSLTGRNQNPYLVNRPSRFKYLVLGWIFAFYPLAVAHRLLGIVKQRLSRKVNVANRDLPSIYGGHGSFIIFNRAYFKRGGGLDNGSFLFCEENYVAEEVRRLGGRVTYQDGIVVIHKEHITTGIMPSRVMTKYLAKAHLLCATRYMKT